MIRLNCFISVTPETKGQVLADALALTENSLKEEGCIAYDVFESCTCPDDVLMICETWADEDALEKHKNSEHYKKYAGHMHELAKLKVEKFDFRR